jgi:hypothetical protein
MAARFIPIASDLLSWRDVIVYVGAAPGRTLIPIIKARPGIAFYLYDPAPFDDDLISLTDDPTYNVNIYATLFDVPEAEWWRDNYYGRMYFISDIRRDLTGATLDEQVEIIHQDMADQYNWMEIMTPYKSSLKFTLPYVQSRYAAELVNYQYATGVLNFQTYSRHKGTESRLIVDQADIGIVKSYNIAKYDNLMYEFNTKQRLKMVNNKYTAAAIGLLRCSCGDCNNLIQTMQLHTNWTDDWAFIKKEINVSFKNNYGLTYEPL